jgi:hypothetical protein
MAMSVVELDEITEIPASEVYSSEMADKETDRRLTALEDKSAAQPPPHSRAVRFLKEYQESVYLVTTLGILFWVVQYHLPSVIDTRTKALSDNVAALNTDVRNMKDSVARIDRNIESLLSKAFDKLLQGTATPTGANGRPKTTSQLRTDIELTQGLVRTAMAVKHKGNVEQLLSVGKSLLETSGSPELKTVAWEALKDVIEYKTSLNPLTFPDAQQADTVYTNYFIPKIGSRPIPTAKVLGVVPIEKAAIFQEIGSPTNPGRTMGNEVFILEGGAIRLDGLEAKHVWIFNSEIHYSGAPVKLSDVVFVNCTFVLGNGGNEKRFVAAILDSDRTDLSIT